MGNCGKHNQKCSGAAYDLDHCVQLVGYDMSGSSPYWKVRNSWGTSWGEDGFIRLPFGKNACGVAERRTSSMPLWSTRLVTLCMCERVVLCRGRVSLAGWAHFLASAMPGRSLQARLVRSSWTFSVSAS